MVVGIREDIDVSSWTNINSEKAKGFLPKTGTPPYLEDLLGDLVDSKFQNGGSCKTLKYFCDPKTNIQRSLRTLPDGNILKNDKLKEQEYSKHSETVIERFSYMIANNGKIPST